MRFARRGREMVEFEDTFWNEFVQTDDHIVPHPGHEYETDPELNGNSNKRPRCDVAGVSSHAGENSASKSVGQPKEDGSFQPLDNIKNTMLDKESWSQTPKDVFSASHDNDATLKMTPHCFQSSNGGAISSDTYSYPLAEMSPTENDLSFLDNDHGDYGWPEIGNFEDVDRMFRSCDSTFGIDSIGNGNELSWFSSSHDVEGSEDVLMNSDFKFSSESTPCKGTPEQYEASKLKHSQLVGNSNAEAGSVAQSSVINEPSVSRHMTFMNDGLKPKELELNGNLQFKETKIPSLIHQVYTSPDIRTQNQSIGADPNSYLQNHVNYMHLDYGDLSNQISVNPTTPGARSEYPESSDHPVQSFENYHDPSLETPDIKVDKKRKRSQYRLGLQSSCKADANHVNALDPSAACNLKSAHKKQVHKLQNELENHDEIDGVRCGNPAEVDSLYAQESSLESGLVDISLEASSFRQLQQVTDKLDIRTKLCIRDSLYRLARSAEQRNNQETLHGSCNGMHVAGAMVVEGTNNFADMETDTNPIDRSIAHLLFHRAPDTSLMPRQDGVSGESHRTIHGSTTTAIPDKPTCHEETAVEIDKAIGHQ
ncbi:protein LNK1 [Impatiens glandulifera]|uniref:protein LNK1 n=1 Tax=Impatiens glandulifera TaxID=253017 RepID=UPI001FB16D59|nr:protein LNK1 [Impatiens glandulifera]XP_047337422.1 protein LNK1 [Impatiens glandulifera]